MEGAGAWDEVPCIVVKGICDYADSHKNKDWQDFAAATAASVMKAILGRYGVHDEDGISIRTKDHRRSDQRGVADEISEPCYYIPLTKNMHFTGRATIIDAIEDKFFGCDRSFRMALVGLGGIGKTQIALNFAYKLKEKRADFSVFLVPVLSEETVERAYMEIFKKLGLRKSSEDDDVKDLVCQHLSSEKSGKWALIVDNADDDKLFLGSAVKPGLEEYLPQSANGIILLTTRSRQIAVDFAQINVIDVEEMDRKEATNLLENSLIQRLLPQDQELVTELIEYLTFLPLAITQAAAYINQTRAPIKAYLDLLRGTQDAVPKVLGREFRDNTRWRGSRNAVGTTWMVSFDQIKKSNQLAIDLLSFLAYIEPKGIPHSILPDAEPDELEWAIGTLCSYSFLVRNSQGTTFDMHSLVHMAIRGWLIKENLETQVANEAICHLATRFPSRGDGHYDIGGEYLPHATQLLRRTQDCKTEDRFELLEKLGDFFYDERRYKEAISCREEVCWWRESSHSEENAIRLDSEHELANAYNSGRRLIEAIKLMEHVVKIRRQLLDEKDHDRLSSEHALAAAYLNNRRIKEAIEILEHIVEVEGQLLDEKDHSRLASEHALAAAYLDNRRIEEGTEILEHVVEVVGQLLDEKDYSRLASEHALATAYLDDHRIEEGTEILEHVVEVRRQLLDEKDHDRLSSEHELARAYLDNHRIEEAIEILEHVVEVWKQLLDEKDHSRLASEHALATAYLDDHRIEEATEILEHVVEVRRQLLDEKDHDRLSSEHELARAYLDHLDDRRIEEATEILEHVVDVVKETLDEKDHDRLASEYALARAYQLCQRSDDAIQILERVVAIEANTLAEDDRSRQLSIELLQKCYEDLEKTKHENEVFGDD